MSRWKDIWHGFCNAFAGAGRGTANMIAQAKEAGIEVVEVS